MDKNSEIRAGFKMIDGNATHLILDEKLWNHQVELFDADLDLKKRIENFKEDFDREFNSSLSKLFYKNEDSKNLLARTINNNPKYNEIINLSLDGDEVLEKYPEENFEGYIPGRTYLSIDLEAAIEQMYDYFQFFDGRKWSDVIKDATNSKILTNSRVFRIEVFHKCKNFRAFQDYVGFILKKIILDKPDIIKLLEKKKAKFHKRLCDELIWDITGLENYFEPFLGDCVISGFRVHVTMYKYDFIKFMHEGGEHIYNTKTFYDTNKVKYQDMLSPYVNQICKFKHMKPIEENDLYYATSIFSKKLDNKIYNIRYLTEDEKKKMTEEKTKLREEKMKMEDK